MFVRFSRALMAAGCLSVLLFAPPARAADCPTLGLGLNCTANDANLESVDSPPRLLAELARRRGLEVYGGNAIDRTVDIARGARVRRAVIGRGARLGADCAVEDSVLAAGVHVGDGCEVRGSVIGPGVEVASARELLGRFVVGDRDRPIDG